MKDGWSRYASEERLKQKGYFRKHCDGGSGRKARETSRCDSLQQSRKREEKEVEIQSYGKVVLLTEDVVYIGDNSGDRAESREGRSGRDEEVQTSVVVVPDVSESKVKRSRKARNSKKNV